MLNIVQVSTFFTEHGGVERSVSDLATALAEQHSVRVLCTTQGRSSKRTQGNIEITELGSAISVSGRPVPMSFMSELASQTADVVHYHLPCPMAVIASVAAQPRAKIKVATWHHDLVRHRLFNNLMRPLTERFLASLDSIIVTAPPLVDSTPILRRFKDKCTIIPLGIDDRRFLAVDVDAVLGIRKKYTPPLILYVGRLVYYKGCDVLLDAMRHVHNATLLMVGTGPLQEQLERKIEALGLQEKVHLLGWQPNEVITNLFQACDIFVLPSTLSTECFGLVQVEAMLCGKPVINTRLDTGVPWVSLHRESGLTVSPSSSLELAGAINTMIDDHDLRIRFAHNARLRAQELFTLRRQVASTVEHYGELLRNTGAAKTGMHYASVRT